MKTLVFLLISILSTQSMADFEYCGQLQYLNYNTATYTNINMNLRNLNNKPPYIIVKDKMAIMKVIRNLTGNNHYKHFSSEDDYSWTAEDNPSVNICLKGSSIRVEAELSPRIYMDEVYELQFKNN